MLLVNFVIALETLITFFSIATLLYKFGFIWANAKAIFNIGTLLKMLCNLHLHSSFFFFLSFFDNLAKAVKGFD